MEGKSNALVGGIFLVMKIAKSLRIDKAELRALARLGAVVLSLSTTPAYAQLIDKTLAPNIANEGINKSLADQIGAGRGDWSTPNSSSFIISRDPFRSIRRGRQLFPRQVNREYTKRPLRG